MNKTCPVCGGVDLTKETREQVIPLEFGRDITIEATVYACPDCGMEGDFFGDNEHKIESVLEEAQKKFAAMIIDGLSEQNISMAYFERAMSLPVRTLARWKRGEVTASASALLKTVKTYPWILEVAEKRFEHTFAVERMIKAAMDEMGTALQGYLHRNGLEASPVVVSSGNTGFVGMAVRPSTKEIITKPITFNKETVKTS